MERSWEAQAEKARTARGGEGCWAGAGFGQVNPTIWTVQIVGGLQHESDPGPGNDSLITVQGD